MRTQRLRLELRGRSMRGILRSRPPTAAPAVSRAPTIHRDLPIRSTVALAQGGREIATVRATAERRRMRSADATRGLGCDVIDRAVGGAIA